MKQVIIKDIHEVVSVQNTSFTDNYIVAVRQLSQDKYPYIEVLIQRIDEKLNIYWYWLNLMSCQVIDNYKFANYKFPETISSKIQEGFTIYAFDRASEKGQYIQFIKDHLI